MGRPMLPSLSLHYGGVNHRLGATQGNDEWSQITCLFSWNFFLKKVQLFVSPTPNCNADQQEVCTSIKTEIWKEGQRSGFIKAKLFCIKSNKGSKNGLIACFDNANLKTIKWNVK